MTRRWAAVIPVSSIRMTAMLRNLTEVEILPVEDQLWLRGTCPSLDDSQLLRLLPGVRPYRVAEDGSLTLLGERVPRASLPVGHWQSLKAWLKIELPAARTSVDTMPSLPSASLTLVRCHDEREATMVLTSRSAWISYANQAPQWRLERLAFVMNEALQILVRGTPLPALPGERWIEYERIFVPAGWKWSPALQASVLVEKMELLPGDIALLFPPKNGNSVLDASPSWQRILAGDWVRATRAAIRGTAEVVRDAR